MTIGVVENKFEFWRHRWPRQTARILNELRLRDFELRGSFPNVFPAGFFKSVIHPDFAPPSPSPSAR